MSETVSIRRERVCYDALSAVFRDGAYSAQALNEALSSARKAAGGEKVGFLSEDSVYVTRLFYGVLEKNLTLEYVIGKLVSKRPKLSVYVILKMGAYMIRYMSTPDYAIVDRCVELAKQLGKSGTSGFINAVLRKVSSIKLPESEEEDPGYLSFKCGLPVWLAEKFSAEYGESTTEQIMRAEEFRTHIRLGNSVDAQKFENACSKVLNLAESKTKFGYYVTHNALNKLLSDGILRKNDYAVQSLASATATHCYADGLKQGDKILDLCAAPGGKAVYLAELTGCKIIACDIHKHRLELIRSYAKRMGVEIETCLNDACVEKEKWLGAFDCVVCDVPCSGTGDLRSRPDILLWRTPEGVGELSKLQSRILRQAARYVKPRGKLCYSTCSLLCEENENVIEGFLRHNSEFALEDCSFYGAEIVSNERCGKNNANIETNDGVNNDNIVNADGKKNIDLKNENNRAEIGLNDGAKTIDAVNVGAADNDIISDIRKKSLKLLPHIHHTDGFFVCVLRKRSEA